MYVWIADRCRASGRLLLKGETFWSLGDIKAEVEVRRRKKWRKKKDVEIWLVMWLFLL